MTDTLKSILIISFLLFILSYLLTMMIMVISRKLRMLDFPNERSSHYIPTPRGGGIAIVTCWYIGIIYLFFDGIIKADLFYALMCGVALACVSLIDDIIGVNPLFRLIVQFLTAISSFTFLGGIGEVIYFKHAPDISFLIYPVAIVGIVWFINLYNFLDGIDGYAAIEAITVLFITFLFTGCKLNLILIFVTLGFLVWNWPNAKIFMGDIGSTQIGFILVILGIYYHNTYTLPIHLWILILSPYWFDATLTLYRRWRNKEKLSQAHKKHVYQRIVQSGFSHLKTDMLLVVLNIIIGGITFAVFKNAHLFIPAVILIIVLLYLITKYADRRIPFK
jgi:Fuc2NAc and GlcNAc transferase